MSIPLTKTAFAGTLNTKFSFLGDDGNTHTIELVELSNGHSTPRQEQFSLLFRGDATYVFPQQIFSLRHDAMGDVNLFLVPVGRDENGTFYEAVFNRLI